MNASTKQVVIQNVVDFFNETWKNKPKPFKYNEYIAKKKNLTSSSAAECRNTAIQPTFYYDHHTGIIKYNFRKIKELPTFIGSLTPNLAIPLICENIFFSYHFLSGYFMTVEFFEILIFSFKFIQTVPYQMSEEAKIGLSDLRALTMILIQIGSLMRDNPNSCAQILLSRSLRFYKQSKYFTSLIDDYDRESLRTCSLIITNQYIEHEMKRVVIQFEKHSCPISHAVMGGIEDKIFLFTLSNKLHIMRFNEFKMLGEIFFGNHLKMKHVLVYFNHDSTLEDVTNNLISNINGGFILCTNKDLRFYSFQSLNKPFLKIDLESINKTNVLGMFLITPNHLSLVFEDESEICVYNIHNLQIVYNLKLKGKVKRFLCNIENKYICCLNLLAYKDVYMIVSYQDSSLNDVDFFKIDIQRLDQTDMLINKQNDNLSIKKFYTLSSYKVKSMKLFDIDPDNQKDPQTVLNVLLKRGFFLSISLKELDLDNEIQSEEKGPTKRQIILYRVKNDITELNLELVDSNSNSHLLLDRKANKVLVYYDHLGNGKMIKIELPDNYDHAYFIKPNKICALKNGLMHIYLIIVQTNTNSDLSKKVETKRTKSARKISEPVKISYYLCKIMEMNDHNDHLTASFVTSI
jgi:hypothetical protein